MTIAHVLRSLAGVFAAAAAIGAVQGSNEPWSPPAGIPQPPFGITEQAPALPSSWTRETARFYYVSRNHPRATDEGNANGWPGRPRRTIPQVLEAGASVLIAGTYDATAPFARPVVARGTAAAPVFIRGIGPEERPTFTRTMALSGSYLVVEHIISDIDRDETNIVFVASAAGNSHHLALRHSDVIGDPRQVTSAGIAASGASETHGVEDVVFYDVEVRDQGSVTSLRDPDAHCAVVGAFVARFWLLDSRLHGCAGDGLQANPGQGSAALVRQRSTHHIYVGRNTAYSNRQSGFWAKNVSDVVFSQNTVYGITRSPSSPLGQCIGGQYGPVRLWIIFNTLHHCETGVAVASTSGLGEGTAVYVVGNVIHDIALAGPNDAANSSSRAAIALWDIPHRYIVHNTIWRAHSGIKNDGSGLVTLDIHGNIIGPPTRRDERAVWVPDQRTFDAGRSSFAENFVGGPVTWERSSRRCERCFSRRPAFLDESTSDFRLTAKSPGIDAASAHRVYETFEKLYGLNIRVDRDGTTRPQGRAWDTGAYESVAGRPSVIVSVLESLGSPKFRSVQK